MKIKQINIKGYTKGVKENNYQIQASNEAVATSRALKHFRKDFPKVQYDSFIIKVS